MNYFITAIDTDSGKTLASAITCEALQADYWKPIQAGLPRDSDTVKDLITDTAISIHKEAYLLTNPMSPHAAAKLDGVTINLNNIITPSTEKDLVIEGAGGCLVPINDHQFILDIIKHLKAEVILVADLYLGSINHTLLTIEALVNRNISIKGIIFNGERNIESERIILLHSKFPCLLNIEKEKIIDRSIVLKYAHLLKKSLHDQC